jgi:hypothetical protein
MPYPSGKDRPSERVWETLIQGRRLPMPPNAALMKPILATVLNVDKPGNEYVVTVQLKAEESLRKFDMLLFENKPDIGGFTTVGWT